MDNIFKFVLHIFYYCQLSVMSIWYKYSCRGFIWKNLDFMMDNYMSSVLGLPHSIEKLTLLQLKKQILFFFLLCMLSIINQNYSNFTYTVICIRTRLNVILYETCINTFGYHVIFLQLKMQFI